MSLIDEFKAFLLRGNVVDLAVAIVVGVAFTALVTQFVESFLTPLIAAIFGEPDFSALDFEINDSVFTYGLFLNALISFLLVAAAVFFFVVKPMNYLMQRYRREPAPDPTTRKCPYCMSLIAVEASRCQFCTSEVTPEPAPAI